MTRRLTPNRKAVDQREPRCPGHDEDGGEEHDQDVFDHVGEEVVVGPVVDRGHNGQ